MPNSRLEIMGDEFLTSIDHYDEFHDNLIFVHSIYRPMCTHMGKYNDQFIRTLDFNLQFLSLIHDSLGVCLLLDLVIVRAEFFGK